MDKEKIREAYIAAIDDGYRHAAVARATGIGVSSLKNFYHGEGGFGDSSAAELEKWLSNRRFMDPEWMRRDPFDGICVALRGMADEIEAEPSRVAKRLQLIAFCNRLICHPAIIDLGNSSETSKK